MGDIIPNRHMTVYRVKAHPGARKDELLEKAPGVYEAWVRAPAEQGRANAAVLALLAARLGIPAKRLRIIKGATTPSKIVQLLG
jgi:uncharacterized protein YggU (UPF0235/DUF167 family)